MNLEMKGKWGRTQQDKPRDVITIKGKKQTKCWKDGRNDEFDGEKRSGMVKERGMM